MNFIASINPAAPQTNQTAAANSADSATAGIGLPPAGLAQAASTNTINAALVSSQWGIDPALVAGVYGGAGASGSNWFSNVELLPALTNLTKANAEQSLSLLGLEKPAVGQGSATASPTSAAVQKKSNTAIPEGANVGAAVVDPLWGKNA